MTFTTITIGIGAGAWLMLSHWLEDRIWGMPPKPGTGGPSIGSGSPEPPMQ